MRWLEVRRHSLTKKGDACGHGSHLSADGVALARALGATLGPFHFVLTSQAPRALETAIAMGYAVNETVDLPSGYVAGEVGHHDQWTWDRPYLRYAELIRAGGQLARVAAVHCDVWTRAVRTVPDGHAALIVSSGGGIEPALVACLPNGDHEAWGVPLGHCEGVRVGYDESIGFLSVEFERL
jgi:broad specificity phosphatase PhoE